jgi:hypothetical protein
MILFFIYIMINLNRINSSLFGIRIKRVQILMIAPTAGFTVTAYKNVEMGDEYGSIGQATKRTCSCDWAVSSNGD